MVSSQPVLSRRGARSQVRNLTQPLTLAVTVDIGWLDDNHRALRLVLGSRLLLKYCSTSSHSRFASTSWASVGPWGWPLTVLTRLNHLTSSA